MDSRPALFGQSVGDGGMRKWRAESVLDLYNLLLAMLLFASPWFFARASQTAAVDLRMSSAAIAIMSLAAMVAFSDWEEWANLLLGVWLVASPWLLGFAHTNAMHFSIGVGAAVAFLAALELWLRQDAAERETVPSAAGHVGARPLRQIKAPPEKIRRGVITCR
jgi:hypothetical protein